MATEHLVVTGKSGAGVSTIAVNLSAVLAEQGYRVAHLSYDRQRISSYLLRGQAPLKAACGNACAELCSETKFHCALGFHGILCIECGEDEDTDRPPRFGTVGRNQLLANFRPDIVVHDIAGEAGSVLPFLKSEGEPSRILVVTSSSLVSLTTLNKFLGAFASGAPNGSRFGGVISNNISGSFFDALVEDFLRQAGIGPLVTVPHSLMVSAGEFASRTVIESVPASQLSSVYRKLARLVVEDGRISSPRPLAPGAFTDWQRKWCEITEELESGLVRDGAAI